MAAGQVSLPILRKCRRISSTFLDKVKRARSARKALEESERRFRAIVEDQTEMICRIDDDLRITFCNRAYARSCGLEPDEVLGREFIASFPAADRKSTRLNSSHANISYAVFCLK